MAWKPATATCYQHWTGKYSFKLSIRILQYFNWSNFSPFSFAYKCLQAIIWLEVCFIDRPALGVLKQMIVGVGYIGCAQYTVGGFNAWYTLGPGATISLPRIASHIGATTVPPPLLLWQVGPRNLPRLPPHSPSLEDQPRLSLHLRVAPALKPLLVSPICKCSISSKAAAYFHNGICFPNLIFVAASSLAPFGRWCCFSLLIQNCPALSVSASHWCFPRKRFFCNIFTTLKIFS